MLLMMLYDVHEQTRLQWSPSYLERLLDLPSVEANLRLEAVEMRSH